MTQDLRPGRLQSFQRTGAQLKRAPEADKVQNQTEQNFGFLKEVSSLATKIFSKVGCLAHVASFQLELTNIRLSKGVLLAQKMDSSYSSDLSKTYLVDPLKFVDSSYQEMLPKRILLVLL